MTALDNLTGLWKPILLNLGVPPSALTGRHGPCPFPDCQPGNDRFRFDDKLGRGTFFCSHCGAGNGVEAVKRWLGVDFQTALKRAQREAGVIPVNERHVPKPDFDAMAALKRLFKKAQRIQDGDVAWQYLRHRGLTEIPDSLWCTHDLYDGDTRESYKGMLAVVQDKDGNNVTAHRTFIKRDVQWLHDGTPPYVKADIPSPKKLMPALRGVNGCAVRLWEAVDVVSVAEGIETAIAAYEISDNPAWATISAGGMKSLELPRGIESVEIFADNDENYTGQEAAYVLARRLVKEGRHVIVHVPPEPGDWLDWWQKNKGGNRGDRRGGG